HHTRPDGTNPQLILSNTTSISPGTADPLAYSLGSAAAQTFTSADPRKLRVEIQVNSVTNGGSFTLGYDSAADQSRLETPSITVLDVALALAIAGVFIPIITALATERRRMATRLISVILALFLALAVLASQVIPVTANPDSFYLHATDTGTAGWYSPDWQYRRKITIQDAQVSGSSNFSYFPVLISSTDLTLRDTGNGGKVSQSDGGDIVFTAANGTTKLDHEIEKYVNTSGQLIAWVEVPTLNATANTDIYLYYGNGTGVADQWNIAGTWDEGGANNFRGVWHEKEDPGPGGAGDIKDSTTNANHGTAAASMTSADQVAGKIDGSLHFDGVDDLVNAGSAASLDNHPSMTMEAWINPAGWGEVPTNGFGRVLDKTTRKMYLISSENGFINTFKFLQSFSTRSGYWFATSDVLSLGTWAQVVVTYNSSSTSNTPTFYLNGQVLTTTVDPNYAPGPSGTATGDGANDMIIGNSDLADRSFEGVIDEARYSNVIRSADWIATEFNNQSAPSSFYSLGSEETAAITPSGKYMNGTTGTGGSTLTFNTAGQNAYWYTDISYPTGGGDASIAAGAYTLNLYFNSLPAQGFPQV
ncbi:MAG: DUF2341 domain-containing protein, partial [Anaerolineales bacterium]